MSYAVVHLAKGAVAKSIKSMYLEGEPVRQISSRLLAAPERPDPVVLMANAGLSFLGSKIYGQGFCFDDETSDATPIAEMERLITKSKKNAERIFPYLGGEEVNTSPSQSPHRYVINFGDMSLEEANRWPDLLAIVREKVKPERDKNKRETRRKYWWRFGETTPALYSALAGRKRCLVTARVTKHLCFSFQPTNRVLNEKLYVFPQFDRYEFLAVLQSRVHTDWAWLLSSTMRSDLNYSASDCFNTFPLPAADAHDPKRPLERIGEKLDTTRSRIMRDGGFGLTVLYNQLKDPACEDEEILALRQLHEDMDRAVLSAYGWSDIAVPPYQDPVTREQKRARQAFSDEVIDRLFALNAERAVEERAERAPNVVSMVGAALDQEPSKRPRKVARQDATSAGKRTRSRR